MTKTVSSTTLVLNRNFTVTSLMGHSVTFVKGVPTHVPPSVYQECLAIGATPPDGEAPNIPTEAQLKAETPHADRTAEIMKAIESVISTNDRHDFTASGAPSAEAISKVTGFKVHNKEIATVMVQYHQKKADEKLAQQQAQ